MVICLIVIDTDANFHCCAYFNDQFRCRSKECKEVIQAINNRKASRKVTDLLVYKPVYQHVIPHKAEELGRIRLPPLRIRE